ncbi:hypothetical protein HMPREF1981_00934 [Bacteroides pyogenes F0041]|uniref:Uncharacterized protein n=1 Tax=Bacteroides pyogenes F0041 TaxID=1321819 RepID=U2CQS7_9BACE|nr:hypothetical protein [Bacteroides pyogenes]ERI86423.1 hypothetical protein HMPREF1981_00934 [Bacteroides pyogenes F0041]GAE22527.1 hypothetical protein JCM10003_2144 [Bacteroides pyogenes JCM 10003]SUV32091.1 Uncharacterised protein [Bacteroides pyogenes]
MNVVTFLLFVGGIAYWVVRQAQKNSEADNRRDFSIPPQPEVSPDAAPVSESWGRTPSLDDFLNPIPYETEIIGGEEGSRKQIEQVERETEKSGRAYNPAGRKAFEGERRQINRHPERAGELYNPKASRKVSGKQKELSRQVADKKALENQKTHRWEEGNRFGQEGERVSKDVHDQHDDRNRFFDDLRTENEDFTIHSPEEARKAIIWGEILQRKHF